MATTMLQASTAPDTTYLSLPINAGDGFPQSFRLAFNSQVYQLLFYVNIQEDAVAAAPDGFVFDLPAPGAFMVLRLSRESAAAPQVIFQRKLVANLAYTAAELALRFTTLRVAKQNLNGAGSFGSQVVGGIAVR
jgi:hypothetical protein